MQMNSLRMFRDLSIPSQIQKQSAGLACPREMVRIVDFEVAQEICTGVAPRVSAPVSVFVGPSTRHCDHQHRVPVLGAVTYSKVLLFAICSRTGSVGRPESSDSEEELMIHMTTHRLNFDPLASYLLQSVNLSERDD
jgi:hypothetical protein